jgi:hypothetical protein
MVANNDPDHSFDAGFEVRFIAFDPDHPKLSHAPTPDLPRVRGFTEGAEERSRSWRSRTDCHQKARPLFGWWEEVLLCPAVNCSCGNPLPYRDSTLGQLAIIGLNARARPAPQHNSLQRSEPGDNIIKIFAGHVVVSSCSWTPK